MTNRHERRAAAKQASAKPKYRRFMAKPGEWPELYDVIFVGLEEYPGQVIAVASPAGRASFDIVFPKGEIAWRAVESFPGLPDDWREFAFVVPTLLDIPDHKLPRRLLDLVRLEDASPDQLAFLMHAAVNDAGGRAAFWSLKENALTQVQMKSQSQFATH